jgi:hypothetical protein
MPPLGTRSREGIRRSEHTDSEREQNCRRRPDGDAPPRAAPSIVIEPTLTAIQRMLITPSANSAATSAQQQPTHQAACLVPISRAARMAVSPATRQNAERTPALAQVASFQRRQLIEGRDREHAARQPAAAHMPGQTGRRGLVRAIVGRGCAACHPRVKGQPSTRPPEASWRPSSRSKRRRTSRARRQQSAGTRADLDRTVWADKVVSF